MSQETICGVYKITHIASGKSYIGISKNIYRRWIQHKSWVNTGKRRSAIYAAMQKYGIDSFTWQVIEQCKVDELEVREQHWIAVFDTFRNGYNLTAGGEYNKEFSDETRLRMSQSHKGRKQSKELIEKRVVRGKDHYTYGKPRSEDTRKKISISLTGKKQSEETKTKRAISKIGKKHSQESIEKMRIAKVGKKASEQAKMRLSESHKGKKHSDETKRKMSEAHKLRRQQKMLSSMQVTAQIQ